MDNEQFKEYIRQLVEKIKKDKETNNEVIKQIVLKHLKNNKEFKIDKLHHQELLQLYNFLNDLLNG